MTSTATGLDVATFCRQRQSRLRERLHGRELDGAVLTDPREVQYFTGVRLPPEMPCVLVIETAGPSWVVASRDEAFVADESLLFESDLLGTTNFDLMDRVRGLVRDRAPASSKLSRLGVQEHTMTCVVCVAMASGHPDHETISIDDELRDLQRSKDELDIAMVRGAVKANLGAYEAVRAAIQPGVTELDVLAAGWRGATLTAGEKLFHDGDYRCGQFNGPAGDRPIEEGEIYIVDAWTQRAGYWSDLSRSFIVGCEPTDLQQSIHDTIAGVHDRIVSMLTPGTHTSEICRAMDAMIREHPRLADAGLPHHGGHGIGMRIHEPPDVNYERGDSLRSGDIVCLEPGSYIDEARAGVRVENMYLINDAGPECLSSYPADLRSSLGVRS